MIALACTRRRAIALAVAALAAAPAKAETSLARTASLQASARAATKRGEPLLLLVSLPGCPYCEQVRSTALLPLVRETGVPAVQIDLGSLDTLVDLDGVVRTQDAAASRLQARFAPTVLFLGANGEALAEPLVGAGIPDFYGAQLEQRVATARAAVRIR
jgi:thioredoxin-related protein